MTKLNAQQLRKSNPTDKDLSQIKRNPIILVLDRIIDTYNVGSLFRLADAIAAKKVFLCGEMEFPPSSKIHKAAVGTEQWTPWEKKDSTLQTIKDLKTKDIQIIAVEQNSRSISYKDLKPKFPCAIVVGAETGGLKQEVLDLADIVVEMPMYGINRSFNVWGSGAIIAYKIIEELL